MRPVIEKKKFELRHILYIIMISICIIAIGTGVYLQFFKDEKLGVIFGFTREKDDVELKDLQENCFPASLPCRQTQGIKRKTFLNYKKTNSLLSMDEPIKLKSFINFQMFI